MTRLTCTTGGSSKFWEARVEGNSLTVRFGKPGTAGQTQVKRFTDAAAAAKELAKLLKEKRAKGYVSDEPPAPRDLGATLAALDPLLAVKRPAVLATLRRGVKPAALKALAPILDGKSLPPDLAEWFAWHDGQQKPISFSTADNYFLHSIESAVDAWRFLNDPGEDIQKPLEPTWLPLFENGAGDHRVYDLDTGAIVEYRHDDRARPKVHGSLIAWAKATHAELENAEAPRKIDASIEGLAWARQARLPNEQQIAKLPPGTAFHYTYKKVMDRLICQLFVKIDDNSWLQASGIQLPHALEKMKEFLRSPPGKESGYWKEDWGVWYDIKDKGKGSLMTAAMISKR